VEEVNDAVQAQFEDGGIGIQLEQRINHLFGRFIFRQVNFNAAKDQSAVISADADIIIWKIDGFKEISFAFKRGVSKSEGCEDWRALSG